MYVCIHCVDVKKYCQTFVVVNRKRNGVVLVPGYIVMSVKLAPANLLLENFIKNGSAGFLCDYFATAFSDFLTGRFFPQTGTIRVGRGYVNVAPAHCTDDSELVFVGVQLLLNILTAITAAASVFRRSLLPLY